MTDENSSDLRSETPTEVTAQAAAASEVVGAAFHAPATNRWWAGADQRFRLSMVALIGLGNVCVLLVSLIANQSDVLAASLAWGTLFGHVVAIGFGIVTWQAAVMRRLGFGFVWLTVLALSIFATVVLSTGLVQVGGMVATVAGIVGMVASSITAFVLWAASRVFGFRIQCTTVDAMADARRSQFSIRQLFVLMTVVAVLFGACRFLLVPLTERFELTGDFGAVLVLALLALLTVLTQVPNWLSLLLTRWWGLALASTLTLTALVAVESPTLLSSINMAGPKTGLVWLTAGIMAVSSGWVLAFASVFRQAGYRLVRRQAAG